MAPCSTILPVISGPQYVSSSQVQDAVQLIIDTVPRSGGGGSGQTREEVVDAMCEDLLAKVGSARILSSWLWGKQGAGGWLACASEQASCLL